MAGSVVVVEVDPGARRARWVVGKAGWNGRRAGNTGGYGLKAGTGWLAGHGSAERGVEQGSKQGARHDRAGGVGSSSPSVATGPSSVAIM